MTGTTLTRRFLFDVRPRHRETLESFTTRLLEANHSTPEHQNSLVRELTTSTRAKDKAAAWMTVLTHKSKRNELYLDSHPTGWLQHPDGSTCEACTQGLPNRVMCTQCAHGHTITQHPHFDDLVCVRHRRWVGLNQPASAQHPVEQLVVDAALVFAKLRRQHRLDLRLYTVLTNAIRTARTSTQTPARVFATVVLLADAITRTPFARRFFNPATSFQDAYRVLEDTVTDIVGSSSADISRAIWLYARPTFWAIRHATITDTPFALAWAHDLYVAESVANSFDLTTVPSQPFSEYLEVTGDSQLTAALHGLTAADTAPLRRGSSRRAVLTICAAGHQTETPAPTLHDLKTRTKHPTCQLCRSRVIVRGYNDLATTRPDLARQFDTDRNDGLTANDVTATSHTKYWWLCPEDHSYQMSSAVRSGAHGDCPYCSNRIIAPGINDLSTTHPELIAEWHPAWLNQNAPTRYSAGSNTMAWWLCPEGHEYEMRIFQRANGKGCFECSRQERRATRDSLAITHPELASEWHPSYNSAGAHGQLSPEDFTAGSNVEVTWLCPVGHHYRQRIDRRVAGYKCSICTRRRLVPGVNDLATTEPVLVTEWHPYLNWKRPDEIFAGTTKYWWLCSNKHKQNQSVPNRVRSRGCTECLPEERALAR